MATRVTLRQNELRTIKSVLIGWFALEPMDTKDISIVDSLIERINEALDYQDYRNATRRKQE
jgi:hypothetical protein